jgi:hypothetical protein
MSGWRATIDKAGPSPVCGSLAERHRVGKIAPAGRRGDRVNEDHRKKAALFLKKSAQKTFAIPGRAGETACGPDSKSFLLLFFKKEAFPFFAQWPGPGAF